MQKGMELANFLTIDEMMIRYKGSYCPSRQYMPNKPEKWGIKVWCLADSITKFVSNFQFYVGKSQDVDEEAQRARRDSTLAHGVVVDLLDGHKNKGHVVTMDNYFTSVGLFKDLLSKGIYATGTVRSNRVGIPSVLKNKKAYRRSPQGTLVWRMHESHSMSSIMWKDKRLVLILSTHARPIQFPCEFPILIVPCRNGPIREEVQTSLVHFEYTKHMCGVDVADQLRASYSCQNCSHKWWHRVFLFLIDMTIVNMCIMYLDECKNGEHPRTPMTHLQFQTTLCEHLLRGWKRRNRPAVAPSNGYCFPVESTHRLPCVVCKDSSKRVLTMCWRCNKHMCFRKGCFVHYHENLNK
jgi:hypothetical protein